MRQRHHTRPRYRLAAAAVAGLVAVSLVAPAAVAKPKDDVLERAHSAVGIGQEKAKANAKQRADEAPGQEHRAQGLERAEAAIAAAADRKAARDAAKENGDKPGRGLGRGHADDVHAILGDGSPSQLDPHGQWVQDLAHAYQKVKANHPGQGNAKTDKGDDDTEGDDK